ncbi:nucleotide exchange factor GrpE [Methylomusa anaerophila]|uniref:Protein GrpE n=1 Tax=Methylomusa anaerophila TaxID=1930071 RepID=A0A348ANX7_9FIRM|nr:nucleotide exchange factor GrpE [Methylomusa anaerophila]BBB92775.1 heat shock protein GrpE [Methylomusa anaerophila]
MIDDRQDQIPAKNREESAGENHTGVENTSVEDPLQGFPTDDAVNQIKSALAEKSRLLDELTDKYKRLQADFDNFRRRSRQEREELSTVVAEKIVCDLLPVIDNFERAIANSSQDPASVTTGIEMIYRQMNNVLTKLGVEPICALGLTFDPVLHEAVMREEDSSQPDGTVIDELQKGYKVHGKVVRPSMVKVICNS